MKCEVCGGYVGAGGGGTLCMACEQLQTARQQERERQERDACAGVEVITCDCGRRALPAVGLCEQCYRDAPRTNPSFLVGGRDLYAGVPATDPRGRFVCPACGGTVRPRPLFGGGGDYVCNGCGDLPKGYKRPAPPQDSLGNPVIEQFSRLTPDQLIEQLDDRYGKKTPKGPRFGLFGPPKAIRDLRRREGRNMITGDRPEPPPQPEDEWSEET